MVGVREKEGQCVGWEMSGSACNVLKTKAVYHWDAVRLGYHVRSDTCLPPVLL